MATIYEEIYPEPFSVNKFDLTSLNLEIVGPSLQPSVLQKNPDPTDQIRIRRIGSDRIYWMRIESGFGFEFDPIRRIRIKFGSIRKFLEPITSFFIKKKTFLAIFFIKKNVFKYSLEPKTIFF